VRSMVSSGMVTLLSAAPSRSTRPYDRSACAHITHSGLVGQRPIPPPDGTGLIRTVEVGFGRVREEITQVGPRPRLEYRLLGGAPVRDHSARIDLGAVTRRALNRMLDAVAERACRP
jgi:hypothetical protein